LRFSETIGICGVCGEARSFFEGREEGFIAGVYMSDGSIMRRLIDVPADWFDREEVSFTAYESQYEREEGSVRRHVSSETVSSRFVE